MLKEKSEHNGTTFLVVKHHTLCQESREPREGWKEITVTNPKTGETKPKWIYPYDSVSGYIDKIEWYDRTDDASGTRFIGYKIHMSDNGELAVLDLPFRSAGYRVFMKIAENLDYGKPVEFAAWYSRKDDSTAFIVRQDDVPLKHRYTVANPGDCPPPVQNPVTKKWDFSAQEVWLKNKIDAEVVPIAEQWATYRAAQAPVTKPQPVPAQDERQVQHAAAVAFQSPRGPQGPRGPVAAPKAQPLAPPSDPYEGGTFDDSVPF